jgi:hypothetical protein
MFKPAKKTSQHKNLLENDENGLQFISKMNSTSNESLYASKKKNNKPAHDNLKNFADQSKL